MYLLFGMGYQCTALWKGCYNPLWYVVQISQILQRLGCWKALVFLCRHFLTFFRDGLAEIKIVCLFLIKVVETCTMSVDTGTVITKLSLLTVLQETSCILVIAVFSKCTDKPWIITGFFFFCLLCRKISKVCNACQTVHLAEQQIVTIRGPQC